MKPHSVIACGEAPKNGWVIKPSKYLVCRSCGREYRIIRKYVKSWKCGDCLAVNIEYPLDLVWIDTNLKDTTNGKKKS